MIVILTNENVTDPPGTLLAWSKKVVIMKIRINLLTNAYVQERMYSCCCDENTSPVRNNVRPGPVLSMAVVPVLVLRVVTYPEQKTQVIDPLGQKFD